MTDRPLDMTEIKNGWLRAREYHPNVEKYYWNTMLKEVIIRVKEIAYIECDGYVKPPLGDERI